MPTQKDLKRLVRARMRKTGESYTAARLHVVHTTPERDYATLAGMSDAAVRRSTGHGWREWVRLLDAAGAAVKSHRDIALHVASLGVPPWWTQMVTVGYERIRGLRQKGQRRDGTFAASSSRTFNVPVEAVFEAFANGRKRRTWLPTGLTARSATPGKRMRVLWDDGTPVQIEFSAKGARKTTVSVQHEKLPDKSAAAAMKQAWAVHLDRLAQVLS